MEVVVKAQGDPQPEDPDELADRDCSSEPATGDHRVLVPADRIACDCARVVTLPGGLQAGAVGPSVGVRLPGEHLIASEVVDEGQRPARGVYPA